MKVPPVPVELMILANEVAGRSRRADLINTLLQEQRKFGFEDIYAAVQRLYALSDALAGPDLADWIARPAAGSPYSAIKGALWSAAAVAPLKQAEDVEPTYIYARFDVADLRRLARADTSFKENS